MSDTVQFRPLRFDGDQVAADDLAQVQRFYVEHDLGRAGTRDTGDDDVTAYLCLHGVQRSTTGVLESDGRAVGSVVMSVEPRPQDVFADIAVPPGPGADAVLDAALVHAVRTGQAAASADGRPGWTLRTGSWVGDDEHASVLQRHGFEPVRRFYRMRIDASSPAIPAAAPPLPEGVELHATDDDETRRAIWALDNEAFLDHWNFTPAPWDEWWHDFDGVTRDPEGWWLLRVDGEPAAFAILDESRTSIGDGYVSVLGVKREFRGRGLASWLLRSAFVRDRERGLLGTQLAVDAENLTGAVGVYERVGMTPIRVQQGWALPLD